MLLACGALAIVQAAFLPGYLAVRALGLHRGGFLRTLLLSFALSLVANHLLVLALVATGLYRTGVLGTLMGAEAGLLLLLVRRSPQAASPRERDLTRWRALVAGLSRWRPPVALAGAAAIMGALWWIGVYGLMAGRNAAATFAHWDAIVSWNRWALDWASGRFPAQTWNYPQLLPTTISLTYVMQGETPAPFFAMALIGLFPLAILLALWDLGLRRADARYALACAATGYVLLGVMGRLGTGLADEPVAAMAFLTLYALVLGSWAGGWAEARGLLAAGAACAAGAALTKQAGWLIAGTYPVLAWLLVIRPLAPAGSKLRAAAGVLALLAALLAPWYIYRALNPSGSEFAYVLQGVHGGRSYAARFERGMSLLRDALGVPMWVLRWGVPAAVLAALLDRTWRWITLLVVVPFAAAYFLFFTYDLRNAALGVAPTVAACAVGLGALAARIGALARGAARNLGPHSRTRDWGRVLAPTAVLGVGAAVVLLGAGAWKDQYLLRRHARLQADLFSPALNQVLLDYHRDEGFDGPVLTNYQVLQALPGLRPLYAFDDLGRAKQVEAMLKRSGALYIFYFGSEPAPEFLTGEAGAARYSRRRAGVTPDGFHHLLLRVEKRP